MDAPAAFRFGHALDTVHAAFVFQPRKDALASDAHHQLAHAAQFGKLLLDHLPAPALGLGIALVHPREIPGKKRRLVAAGTGADLQHGGPRIGGIARQERQLHRVLGLGQARAQVRQFLFGQGLHLGVVQQRLGLGDLGHQTLPFGDLGHHRTQVGIFTAQRGNIALTRRHAGLDVFQPFLDLLESLCRDHPGCIAHPARGVKTP